jgi:PKD repeat protein
MYDWDYFIIVVNAPNTPLTVSADPNNFGSYEGIVDQSVQLFGVAFGGVSPYVYEWSLGDGRFVYDQNPLVAYDSAGYYSLTLTVTDSIGDSDLDTTELFINGIDEFSVEIIGSLNAVVNSTLYFESSIYGGIEAFTYDWDFGDGSTSNLAHPTHVYTAVGVYLISLIVTDSEGNIATDDIQVVIDEDYDIVTNSSVIQLYDDWNLITIPVTNNYMASDVCSLLYGSLSISGWDTNNQTYKTYIVGGPSSFDFEIIDGSGYFIDMIQSEVLSINGYIISDIYIPLEIGWNLLGWYHDYDSLASTIGSSIPGCLSLSSWDSVNQTYQTYIVGGPSSFDFTVSQNMGLFVDVDQESIWTG